MSILETTSHLSPVTGEITDQKLEDQFRLENWPQTASQLRIVLIVCCFGYLATYTVAAVSIFEDEGISSLWLLRLFASSFMVHVILNTWKQAPPHGHYWSVFVMEVVFGCAEAYEQGVLQIQSELLDPMSTPFFAFAILLYCGFIDNRMKMTVWACLVGSVATLAAYWVALDDPTVVVFRHGILLFGTTLFGAGLLRSINQSRRKAWLNARALSKEIEVRMKAEAEAQKASEVKSEFLAVMSHEIRTPLNAILAMADGLNRQGGAGFAENDQEKIKVLSSAGHHLSSLVDDVLDFSQIESNVLELHESDFAVRPTLEQLMSGMQFFTDEKGLGQTLNIAPDVPAMVHGDARRLRQILINLVGNAVKFTDEGAVSLHVTPMTGESKLMFTVRDTGRGIPTDKLETIFQPFYQADTSSSRSHGGAGLGLAICRQLVELMGGTIAARNHPEGGAEFTVSLPLQAVEGAEFIDEVETGHKGKGQIASNTSLLIIEDSSLNHRVFEEFLSDSGATLTFARSGQQGLDLLHHQDFDLVLLDLQMPEMDGIAVLNAMEGMADAPPVVVVTADSTKDTQTASMRAGAVDFLAKPFTRDQLLQTLSAHLSAVSSAEQGRAELSHLLPKFYQQLEEDLAKMMAADEAGEMQAVQEYLHAMKGHCALFGFEGEEQKIALVEANLKAQTVEPQGLKTLIGELHMFVEKGKGRS